MFFQMYIAPGQGETTFCGQNPDVNKKALSLCHPDVNKKALSLCHLLKFQKSIFEV